MKKNISKILIIIMMLAIASISLFACGENNEPCAEHKDDNADNICDICEATLEPSLPECEHRDENADYECDKCGSDFFPECYDHINENNNAYCDICGEDLPISITVKVCDQEGNIISGIKLSLSNEDGDAVSGVTNELGEVVFSLIVGSYRVSYDEQTVPEGYIAYSSSIVVSDDTDTIALEIINNIPNGTMERPFVVNPENEFNSVTQLAGEKTFYIVPHGGSRIVSFIGSDYEVVYYARNGEEYLLNTHTPDEDGRITFRFTEPDIKTPSMFTIENKGDTEEEFTIELRSEPGTMAKPYEITDISSSVVCEGVADKTIYYKWIATENGELIISSETVFYSIRIGSTDAVLLVKNGDEAGLIGQYTALTPEGSITLMFSEDRISVVDSAISSIVAGTEYKYEMESDGKLVIKDASTDAEIEPFAISPAGRVITITNNRNSSQQRIEENAEGAYINVQTGDEIIIAVYTSFDMNVEFTLGY